MDKKEQATGKFFDKDVTYWEDKYQNGLAGSAVIQVKEVRRVNPNLVVDVGSGPGTLLIEMVKEGAKAGVGVDLSAKLCGVAEQKVREEGLADRIEIRNESFLDSDLPSADVVSFHQVLCCHHDPEGMLTKADTLGPKAVVVTVPRSIPILRQVINGIFWIKTKLFGGFRAYMHSQKMLDDVMEGKGFELDRRDKRGFWALSTYLRKSTGER